MPISLKAAITLHQPSHTKGSILLHLNSSNGARIVHIVVEDNDDIENTYFIAIKPENIFTNDFEDIAQRISNNLVKNNVVVVHSSLLIENPEQFNNLLLEHELSRQAFISKICDYLAAITRSVLLQKEDAYREFPAPKSVESVLHDLHCQRIL